MSNNELKQYLKDNLVIRIKKENEMGDNYITVYLYLEDEEISSDFITTDK